MISAHGELCGARSDTTRANLLYYRPGAYMNADICFRFNKSEWKGLAQRLDEADEGAWAEAIGVFERRMRERFLSSIEALFKADTKPDTLPPYPGHTENCIPGFSIIALCCLLVDTLQGFREKPPRASAPPAPAPFRPGIVYGLPRVQLNSLSPFFDGQLLGRHSKTIQWPQSS